MATTGTWSLRDNDLSKWFFYSAIFFEMNYPPFYLLLGNPLVRQKLVQPWPHRHHCAVGIWGNFEQLEYVSNNLPLVFSLCWTGRQEVRLTYVKVRQVEEHLDLLSCWPTTFCNPSIVEQASGHGPTRGGGALQRTIDIISLSKKVLWVTAPQWQAPVNPWANWLFSIQRFIFFWLHFQSRLGKWRGQILFCGTSPFVG